MDILEKFIKKKKKETHTHIYILLSRQNSHEIFEILNTVYTIDSNNKNVLKLKKM